MEAGKLKKSAKSSKPHIVIAFIVTLVITITYSSIVHFFQNEKLWDWFNALVGSGVSFFLAVIAGMYLFRLQTAAEDTANLESAVSLLTAELSDLISILGDSSRMEIKLKNGESKLVLIAFIQPLVIEKAAISGLFTRAESENLLHLARKLRMLNFKSEYFISLLSSHSNEQLLVNSIDNIEQTLNASVEGIHHVARQLGLNISAPIQTEGQHDSR